MMRKSAVEMSTTSSTFSRMETLVRFCSSQTLQNIYVVIMLKIVNSVCGSCHEVFTFYSHQINTLSKVNHAASKLVLGQLIFYIPVMFEQIMYQCPPFVNAKEFSTIVGVPGRLFLCLSSVEDEIKTKLHLQKIAGYSMCGAGPPYLVAGYVPGAKVHVGSQLVFCQNQYTVLLSTSTKSEILVYYWSTEIKYLTHAQCRLALACQLGAAIVRQEEGKELHCLI